MAVVYDRVYKVPQWAVVNLQNEKQLEAIENWFEEADALEVTLPGLSFVDTCKQLTRQGYSETLMLQTPYIINEHVFAMAVNRHVKNFFGDWAFLSAKMERPIHNVNRLIKSDEDYVRAFHEALNLQPRETLSFLFKVGERCHYDRKKYGAFVSYGDAPLSLLTKISDRVIKIGDDVNSDIVIEKADKKQKIVEKLETYFTKGA
jgi:hypothetical protein